MVLSHVAYQNIPTNEMPDNSNGSTNLQVFPESGVNPSFGDGGTKRSLQERQWVAELFR